MISRPPRYCGLPLDRHHLARDNPDWIKQQLDSAQTRILPLWRDRNLFTRCADRNQPLVCWLAKRRAVEIVQQASALIYLGQRRTDSSDSPLFAADLSHLDADCVRQLVCALDEDEDDGANAEFIDLRAVCALLTAADAAILAYARGLAGWRRQNQHCGSCGSLTRSHRGGHMRRCADAQCAREIFPRIDPAVIMLVEQQTPRDGLAKCLLARNQRTSQPVYSTLAGYVEPGESLEEAVAREVQEESGLRICQTTYFASQPWPFASSLMLGFHAATRDRQITIARNELADCRWFSAAEIEQFGEHSEHNEHGEHGEHDTANKTLLLPRTDSIARDLIETWLRKHRV